ncbi:MAG: ABC transporter permease [Kiloniellales bacterium]
MLAVRDFGLMNGRGLFVLTRRGVERFFAQWMESLAGPLASSFLFLLVFVLARGGRGDVWPGVDWASFIAGGIVMFAACHAAFESLAMNLLHDKMEGMMQDVVAAPLTALEIVLAWVAGAVVNGLVVGALVGLAMMAFVDWHLFWPLSSLLFAFLGVLLFALVGLLVGLWAEKWDHYAFAEAFLILPLALLSGTFYLKEDLPPLGEILLQLNPVFYAFDGFRAGLLGRADSSAPIGQIYLLSLCLLLGVLAWRLVARSWRLKA